MIVFDGETCEDKIIFAEDMVRKYKYDSMTRLKGRLDFDEAFERMVDSRIYDGRRFIFALIDINGLKYTNDNFGYLAGDKLIKKVAYNLSEEFKDIATIYRFGGDEFALLCTGNLTRVIAKEKLNNINSDKHFCYGIMDSEEVNWKDHNYRSIFTFVNNLLVDKKSQFKEDNQNNQKYNRI